MNGSFWTEPGRTVGLPLDEPPRVAGLGVGVHGTTRSVSQSATPSWWRAAASSDVGGPGRADAS